MKKTLSLVFSFILFCAALFSQSNNSWNFNLTTDIVYYPYSDFIAGPDHFSPISSPLDTAAFRVTGTANYVIPVPLGEHWLLQDSHVTLQTNLQILPVSIRSINRVIYTPFPFLEFEAGTSLGMGWNIGTIKGLTWLNQETQKYEDLSSIKNLYYDFWFMGTFMFDTGAVFPGDWTHVVMMAQYQVIYKGLTGLSKGDIYNWQTTPGQTKGLQYDNQLIIAYQMPLVLYRAGLMTEFTAHYDSEDYAKYSKSFKGDFETVMISPFVQFKFQNNDTLIILCQFSNRRSFEEPHKKLTEEMDLRTVGNEWFVNMFAASWTHYF